MVNYLPNFNFRVVIKKPTAPIIAPCMDQICGWIDTNGNYNSIRKWKTKFNVDYLSNRTAVCRGKAIKSPIVVILESPHVDEFDASGTPKGPAQGKTGNRFDKYFEQLINSSSVSNVIGTESHAVVLVNSVQYQCSLGKQPLKGKNRSDCDKNWKSCFNAGGNTDLVNRLNALKPVAVINLCTASLKKDVDQQICHFSNYTCGYHPASWHWRKYREIQ